MMNSVYYYSFAFLLYYSHEWIFLQQQMCPGVTLVLHSINVQCYNHFNWISSSGQGAIPYRRYSPRTFGPIWWDSKTDSIVWMREELGITRDRSQRSAAFVLLCEGVSAQQHGDQVCSDWHYPGAKYCSGFLFSKELVRRSFSFSTC